MSKPSTGRPVAPAVDPLTPEKPQPHDVGRTQDAKALGQEDRGADTGSADLNAQSPNLNKEDDSKALPGNGGTEEVETVKVKTKGAYMLMDPFSTASITQEGAEVPVTSFINDELAEGGRLEKA